MPVEATYVPRLGHGIDDTGISMGALALQRAFSAHDSGMKPLPRRLSTRRTACGAAAAVCDKPGRVLGGAQYLAG